MKGIILIIGVIVILESILVSGFPKKLKFEIGDEIIYKVHSKVNSRGYIVSNDSVTGGAFSYLDGYAAIKCADKDSYSYLFVMNMFDVVVTVGQDSVTESQFIQTAAPGSGVRDWMGEDMFFIQNDTGIVTDIRWNVEDVEYFVHVKTGVINSFNTYIVKNGSSYTTSMSDVVGKHKSLIKGSVSDVGELKLDASFNQHDVIQFADANLKPHNVDLSSYSTNTLHNDGYLTSNRVQLRCDLVSLSETVHGFGHNYQQNYNFGDQDQSGFDTVMSTKGDLHVDKYNSFSSPVFPSGEMRTFESVLSDKTLVKSSLMEYARMTAAAEVEVAVTPEIFERYLEIIKNVNLPQSTVVPAMRHMIEILKELPGHIGQIVDLLDGSNYRINDRVFYILASCGSEGQKALIHYGFVGDERIQLQAVTSFLTVDDIDEEVITALRSLSYNEDIDVSIRKVSIHVLGSIAGHTGNVDLAKELSVRFMEALEMENDDGFAVSFLNALGNAGPSVIPWEFFPAVQVLKLDDPKLDLSLSHAVRKYVGVVDDAMFVLLNIAKHSSSYYARNVALTTLGESWNIFDDDFPYNKNYTKDWHIGGSILGFDLTAEAFAGTNFDCEHQTFNYEVLGHVLGTGTILDFHKDVIDAKIIYGRKDGNALADDIYLKVWGEVVYDHPLPSVDCIGHTYDIVHTHPGFHFKYVIWISIVPVTLSIGASVKVDVTWGWNICPDQLTADVKLTPEAILTVDGSAVLDILWLKAGVEISGDIGDGVVPDLILEGSECQLEFVITEKINSLGAKLDSFYQWKKCKYLFFDCHWADKHEHDWWRWSRPAKDHIIYDKIYKIHK